jgi:hypothetical protein
LIGGGDPAAVDKPIQELALDLLYAPRFMEDPTMAIPAWSSAPANPKKPLYQLQAMDWTDMQYAPSICAMAAASFKKRRCPPMTAGELLTEAVWRLNWRAGAAAEIGRSKLDQRRRSDRSTRHAGNASFGGGLQNAAFWIHIGPSDVVPAYALYWTGPTAAGLVFVVQPRPNRYAVRFLPADCSQTRCVAYDNGNYDNDDAAGWHEETANRPAATSESEPTIWYDRRSRVETLASTALAALDPSTGKLAGLSIIRGGISTDPFPDELVFEIVKYLLLPPMPAAMHVWLDDNERSATRLL